MKPTLEDVAKLLETLGSGTLVGWSPNEYRDAAAVIREAMGALATADEALRDYACHGGPGVPCKREKHQCASECGKAAGDALLVVGAALAGGK